MSYFWFLRIHLWLRMLTSCHALQMKYNGFAISLLWCFVFWLYIKIHSFFLFVLFCLKKSLCKISLAKEFGWNGAWTYFLPSLGWGQVHLKGGLRGFDKVLRENIVFYNLAFMFYLLFFSSPLLSSLLSFRVIDWKPWGRMKIIPDSSKYTLLTLSPSYPP